MPEVMINIRLKFLIVKTALSNEQCVVLYFVNKTVFFVYPA